MFREESPSVYLRQPHAGGGEGARQERTCRETLVETPGCLDAERPSVWLNDLAFDTFRDLSPSGKTAKGALHYGDIAAVERHVEISSCALILGLLYAERLHRVYDCKTPDTFSQSEETGCAFDRSGHAACGSSASPPGDCNGTKIPADSEINDPNHLSSSDLFLMSVLLANKYLYDEGELDALWNSEWAEAGRRKLKTVHRLEAIFLNLLNWRLFVGRDEFKAFLTRVEKVLALRAAACRGGALLYQDVDRLWETVLSQALVAMRSLSMSIVLCTGVYALFVSLFLLSPAVVSLVQVQSSSAMAVNSLNLSGSLESTPSDILSSTPATFTFFNSARPCGVECDGFFVSRAFASNFSGPTFPTLGALTAR